MAPDRMSEVVTLDNVMALTTKDLSASTTLLSNVQLRNTPQKSVGDLHLEADGMS